MMIRRSAVLIATALLPTLATGQVTDRDRFQLENNCLPLVLAMEVDDAKKLDDPLYKSIRQIARISLLTARIYEPDGGVIPHLPYLVSHVTASDGLFLVGVELHKYLQDPLSGDGRDRRWSVATWRMVKFGAYGSTDHVTVAFADIMEEFVDEYLRVNAIPCQWRSD